VARENSHEYGEFLPTLSAAPRKIVRVRDKTAAESLDESFTDRHHTPLPSGVSARHPLMLPVASPPFLFQERVRSAGIRSGRMALADRVKRDGDGRDENRLADSAPVRLCGGKVMSLSDSFIGAIRSPV